MKPVDQTAELAAHAPDAPGAVDEELLALPGPPRGRRLLAMTLMAAVVVGAMALLTSVRTEIAYFFASDKVQDLGQVTALVPAELTPNRFVRVRGTPMLSRMVRFEQGLSSTEYVAFPLAGQRNVFVQVRAEAFADPELAARGTFSGRLVTFGQLGARVGEVRAYLSQAMGVPVTAESFLVVADEAPASYVWALLLALGCLGVVVLNVWLMRRWFRPLRAD